MFEHGRFQATGLGRGNQNGRIKLVSLADEPVRTHRASHLPFLSSVADLAGADAAGCKDRIMMIFSILTFWQLVIKKNDRKDNT